MQTNNDKILETEIILLNSMCTTFEDDRCYHKEIDVHTQLKTIARQLSLLDITFSDMFNMSDFSLLEIDGNNLLRTIIMSYNYAFTNIFSEFFELAKTNQELYETLQDNFSLKQHSHDDWYSISFTEFPLNFEFLHETFNVYDFAEVVNEDKETYELFGEFYIDITSEEINTAYIKKLQSISLDILKGDI